MSFPRYPSYKPSGVEWLGEVPEHWEILAIKRLASLQSGNGITADSISEDGPYPVYGGNGVRGFSELFTHEGDYPIIGRQGALCGNINYANGKFWASEHAIVVSPSQSAEVGWLGEVLRAMNLNQYSVSAAQPGLSVDTIVNLFIPRPPRDEQISIATFLTHETAKIDALIAEQQRLIELLQEKRQAVISHAVTKGLNPDAPMKDSGVEWLGELPEHWSLVKLKHVAKDKVAGPYGASLTKSMYTHAGYRVYGQQQVIPDNFEEGDYYINDDKYEEMKRYSVSPGDVLISVMGTVGKVAVVPDCVEPGIINPRLVRYHLLDLLIPRFVQRLLLSTPFQEKILLEAKGATMDGLNMQILGDLPLPVPPRSEQEAILDQLLRAIASFDAMASSTEQSVLLLKERRSALISAAVTGKIDVRGLVPEAVAA